MKVTVNEKVKQPQIDWDDVQLVEYNGSVIQVAKDQDYSFDEGRFCGQDINNGKFSDYWLKSEATIFTGTITIEQ